MILASSQDEPSTLIMRPMHKHTAGCSVKLVTVTPWNAASLAETSEAGMHLTPCSHTYIVHQWLDPPQGFCLMFCLGTIADHM